MPIKIPIHIPIINQSQQSPCRNFFEGYWYWGKRRAEVIQTADDITYVKWRRFKKSSRETIIKVILLFSLIAPIIGTIWLFNNYFKRKKYTYEIWPSQIASPSAQNSSKVHQHLTHPIPPDPPKKKCKSDSTELYTPPILCENPTKLGNYTVSAASTQGFRKSMEDSHFYKEILLADGRKIPLFAVMDGHGGKECSLYIKNHFPDLFAQEMNQFDWDNRTVEEKYKHLKHLSALLEKGVEANVADGSGSTMVCAFVINNDLWVMNTGDSRAVLDSKGTAIQLSEDANLKNPRFTKKIFKYGGTIYKNRLNGILAVSRAYGNVISGSQMAGLTAHPKITKFCLRPQSNYKLILACDGLWDTVGSQEAVSALHTLKYPPVLNPVAFLINLAISKGSTDNITVLVIDI